MNKFKSDLKVQCIFQFWNVNVQRPWTFLGVLDRSLSIQRYSPFLNVSSPFLSFSVYKKVSDAHKTVENAHGTFRNGLKRSFKLSCKRSYNRSRTVNAKRLGTFVPGCNNALERIVENVHVSQLKETMYDAGFVWNALVINFIGD
jgi:hypothetical protein